MGLWECADGLTDEEAVGVRDKGIRRYGRQHAQSMILTPRNIEGWKSEPESLRNVYGPLFT